MDLKNYSFPLKIKKDFKNLNEIAKKDFGYGEHTHFLDFLNQKKSKWELIFKHVLPQDTASPPPVASPKGKPQLVFIHSSSGPCFSAFYDQA